MINPLDNAGLFVVDLLFNLYLFAMTSRILLQYMQVDFYNPICQFLWKITEPVIHPLRQVLPRSKVLDIAALVVLMLLALVKLSLLALISGNSFPGLITLVLFSIADVINFVLDIFFYAILLQVIISWINPSARTPLNALLYALTEPVLRPIRQFVPLLGGIDFSPLIALIILKLAAIIIVQPFYSLVF